MLIISRYQFGSELHNTPNEINECNFVISSTIQMRNDNNYYDKCIDYVHWILIIDSNE